MNTGESDVTIVNNISPAQAGTALRANLRFYPRPEGVIEAYLPAGVLHDEQHCIAECLTAIGIDCNVSPNRSNARDMEAFPIVKGKVGGSIRQSAVNGDMVGVVFTERALPKLIASGAIPAELAPKKPGFAGMIGGGSKVQEHGC